MKKTPLKRGNKQLKRSGFRKSTVKPKKSVAVPKQAKKRKGKTKPERVKTLKKKLWTIFSIYIRKKDADHAGYVTCCDTGERVYWQTTHCGHLFHGTERNSNLGGNELWYYENNFAPQSPDGNRFNKDDSAKRYTLYAVRKYGIEEVDKMYKMRHTPKMWTEEELIEKYNYYKSLVEKL